MILQLSKDAVAVRNFVENTRFVYDRRHRIKFDINEVYEPEDMDTVIDMLIENSILTGAGNTGHPYAVKEIEDVNLSKITIEAASDCSLPGKHCFGQYGTGNGGFSAEHIFRLLDGAAELGAYELVITGGEPLLYSRLGPVIEHAYSRGFIITLFSNLTLTGSSTAPYPAMIDTVIISAEADDAGIRDSFKGKEGAYDLAVSAVKHLISAGV